MTTPLFYECQKSKTCIDEYVVEAIDYDSEGEIYAAIFSGHGAKERAEEYAAWKNGTGGATVAAAIAEATGKATAWGSAVNVNITITSNRTPDEIARKVVQNLVDKRRYRNLPPPPDAA